MPGMQDKPLPPLGDRGWTPEDISTLPELPIGFVWRRPYVNSMVVRTDSIEIAAHDQRVALIAALITHNGWLSAVGGHREELGRRHHIWTLTFDRAVDYAVGWITKYPEAIAAEAQARHEALMAQHRHRIPMRTTEPDQK